jgi:hypothetical protein
MHATRDTTKKIKIKIINYNISTWPAGVILDRIILAVIIIH